MDDFEYQILNYDELPAEERRAVDAYLAEHPDADSLLAEGRALRSLLEESARFGAEVPDASGSGGSTDPTTNVPSPEECMNTCEMPGSGDDTSESAPTVGSDDAGTGPEDGGPRSSGCSCQTGRESPSSALALFFSILVLRRGRPRRRGHRGRRAQVVSLQ